jgi:hypothetical protein
MSGHNPNALKLPAWVAGALNGKSVRVATEWRPVDTGDLIAGLVVETRRSSLTVSLEVGVVSGAALEPGAWVRISTDSGVLRKWRARDEVTVGDRVAISFRGRGAGAKPRWDFIAGTWREEEPVRAW